jgi:hypothetical protein
LGIVVRTSSDRWVREMRKWAFVEHLWYWKRRAYRTAHKYVFSKLNRHVTSVRENAVTVNRGSIRCDDVRASPVTTVRSPPRGGRGPRLQRIVLGPRCRGSLDDCADCDVDGAPRGGRGGRDEVLEQI